MPATPTRIGFIQSEFRSAVATTSGAKTQHGNLARESDDPIETWFDSVTDAQAIATERQALLSPERRRFQVGVKGMSEIMALSFSGSIPVATLTDSEFGVTARKMLVSEVTLDFGAQQGVLTLWG